MDASKLVDGMMWGLLQGLWQGAVMLWPVWLVLGGIQAAKLAWRMYERKRLFRSGIDQIDRVDGRTFEKYLESLFLRLGYRVELTKYVGDYGADLVTRKAGVRTVIQAKRYKKKVGVQAIQEAVAAKGYYDCQEAMVVTNSYYTEQARTLARANKVVLWDRDDLVKALLQAQSEAAGAAPVVTHVPAVPTVPAASTVPATPVSPAAPVVSANVAVPPSEVVPVTSEEASAGCATCGKSISAKVRAYCESNPTRFQGRVYCYEHQRASARERYVGEIAAASADC